MWSSNDESGEQTHNLLMLAGFALLLVAAAVFYMGTTRSHWPVASAQVLTVEVRCSMRANSYSRYSGRPRSVIIGCDQVERFRADNPGRSWNMTRLYSGDVRVVRDGKAVTVEMGLGRLGGAPRVGDRFEVAQNPDIPSDVAYLERGLSEVLVGMCIGGLGLFVLALAFFWF